MSEKLTLRTIARKAGVSATTVSRALGNREGINPETRKKILSIANELGYTPNHLARSLKVGKTKTVGVIVSDISNPFFSVVIDGIEKTFREKGYSILLCDSDEDVRLESKATETLLQRRVDGVIITPVDESTFSARFCILQKAGIPCVLLARYVKGLPVSYVVADDVLGGFIATEHLIQKGHKKILYLAGPSHLTTSQERLEGYRKALNRYRLKEVGCLIQFTKAKMEDGYQVVKKFLDRQMEFTAIASFNDYLAFGALRALRERNLKIPEDVAVVGYDDVEFAEIALVPLTTVRISGSELGNRAAKLLLSYLKGKVEKPQKVIIMPELILREST